MNHSRHTRPLTAVRLGALRPLSAAAGAIVAIGLAATPGPAFGTPSSDQVIASDTVAAASSAPSATAPGVPTATASRPRTIVVTHHGGTSVTLFAKAEPIRRVLAPGSRPAVFTKLTPGRTYTVAVGGQPIATVVALNAPAPATTLSVRTTSSPGTVTLSWRHSSTAATGGASMAYDIVASAPGAPTLTATSTTSRTAVLTGLDPAVLYTFTVTPRNSAGRGKPTRASMSRTLAQLGNAPAAPAIAPISPQPTTPATPAPTPSAAPAPSTASSAPAPRPTTRTIWVCPDGFTESSGVCRKTMAYTFHRETETAPYTYHSEQQLNTISVPATYTGSYWTWSCPSGYDAGGGQWGVGVCKGTITVQVKDAPPGGWYDNGSTYAHDLDVKDAMPTGYLDDGTQWVTTAAKIAQEVPA